MIRRYTAPILLAFAVSCAGPQLHEHDEVAELGAWMTGVFDSSAQAETNPRYFPVQLAVAPIWTGRDDGPWLYVEQGMMSALERPYRQRVYHLVDNGDGTLRSEVYALPDNPLVFVGAYREPARFDELGPEDLLIRKGCAIALRREGDTFVGSTHEKDCESSLRGATYATSEVVISAEKLTSWDRGYDASDTQVWGAVDGPYVFERQR